MRRDRPMAYPDSEKKPILGRPGGSIMQEGASGLLSRIKQPRLAFAFAAAGALAFWVPDVVAHVMAGREFNSSHVKAITLALPITFLIAYVSLRKVAAHRGYRPLGVAMLMGVWLTGGFFMMIAAMASGGGFASADGVRHSLFITALSVIPLVTYMMATYDGSLFALLAVTVGSFLTWSVGRNGMLLPYLRRSK